MLIAPVKIGAHAQTGAGAVVKKDVPPGALVAGVPARLLRMPQAEDGSAKEGSEKEQFESHPSNDASASTSGQDG